MEYFWVEIAQMAEDNPKWLASLQAVLRADQISTQESDLEAFSHDETEDIRVMPQVICRPSSTQDVSAIMRVAYAYSIPVTPAAARTGLSGGAIPVQGGISLSMERLNQILDIDAANFQARVEPGVINQVFHEACKVQGLFYPPDPSSWGTSTMGGNVAYNAGGPKAVKYGVTSAYVLNLEVVLPNGEIIWTGANTLKNSTGYNLTQLMVGSEGTLGVITQIVVRLIPYPKVAFTLLAPFASAEAACEAVSKIFQAGVTPSGLEFMERDAIDWTLQYLDGVSIPTGPDIEAHLLMEVDGFDEEAVLKEAETMAGVVEEAGALEVLFAQSSQEREAIWKLRRRVGEAVKSHSIYKEQDTVVPRAQLPALLKTVKQIGSEYGFKSVCYGHAGDGNLHVNIVKGEMSDADWDGPRLKEGIRHLFREVVAMGGTISGEHGIGLVQKPYLDIAFSPIALSLQKSIKSLFDSKGIMNPGKIFN
ncbi:MAG: FAD-linked oxidase C-terminal domain-containing protein [Schleiferiaceae bacterium]|nr:FAD-linked oxidase C-terminal domain-containing protein [Schleiferiaceae bacterium]